MKRVSIFLTAIIAVSFLLVSWSASKTFEPAAHISDFNCLVPDGDGGLFLTDRSQTIITSSGNGNMRCQATGVPNSTGKAVVTSGFGCNTQAGFTTQTHATVSASGNATLQCKVRP